MGRDQPLPRQRIADSVRAETEPSVLGEGESAEMPSRDSFRRARMRPLPPIAVTMRAKTMINAMTGTDLFAAALGVAVTEHGGAVSGR